MGNCCIGERVLRRRGSANNILKQNKIFYYLNQMLDGSADGMTGIAYTQNQAIDLAKALIEGLMELQTKENKNQRLICENLFSQNNIELIRKQELFYHGLLQQSNVKNELISQNIKSRVYHKLANIKKQNKIEDIWQNPYEINCIKSNDYKLLSQEELNDVVKCEVISDHVHRMGEKIGFKFESIKRESQRIHELIQNVIMGYSETIKNLDYNLQTKEVMTMAKISREACKYYDNGVFILLVYFVQSSKKLQNAGKTAEDIQIQLNDAIQEISKEYPPGEGLSKENQLLISTLRRLQIKDQGFFQHQQITMKPANKQAQVQSIVKNYAEIAEQCKELFEELVKQTCLQRSVLFKIGLKFYPDNHNPKAMTRIKEKMLIGKEKNVEKNMKGTIQQILRRQNDNYRQIIDDLLKNTKTVRFKISDMVRGKCVFLEVSDIIEAVKSIKEFVKNDSRFTIEEIESRFTNKTPVSDVTLKIVINKKIKAELQLTIQTNAASYNFAHKIYQLQRTKVFSKLKIIHNYFQEYKDDFYQHATRSLSMLTSNSKLPLDIKNNIQHYFKLSSIKNKTFLQIIDGVLQQKDDQLPKFAIVVDPLLQDLMLGIFCVVTGIWYKELGKIINNALNNQSLSPKLKSVLLSSFLDKFQLPKESEYMQQLGIQQQQLTQKIFMEEFIREYFQIDNIFRYTSQNHRVFHRAQQLKQIQFEMKYSGDPIQLRQSRFAVNLIIEQSCFQNIARLRQMFDFYFVTRDDKKDTIYNNFSSYYNWINRQLDDNNNLDKEGLLSSQIAIIKAQQLLENGEKQQASEILQQAKRIFQKKEKQEKVIYCDVLLAECFIRANKKFLKKSIEKHTQVIKKAETLGLQMKGALYADALWRISEYLWSGVDNVDEKRTLLESFTKMAIRQMSRSKGKQFIYALKAKWDQFGNSQGRQRLILQNEKIGYVKLYGLGPDGCSYLTIAKWKNLKKLNLSENKIGDDGCRHLSKGKWADLTHLDLYKNNIGTQGCMHLGSAQWKNLSQLSLWDNNIRAEGCKHLGKANWDHLTHINLNGNSIEAEGCKYLSSNKWDNLYLLNLGNNSIKAQGCKHLCTAKWNSLSQLYLWKNSIGDEGCKYLSSAVWDNLTQLDLNGNGIGDEGCKHLSSAKWEKLIHLNLRNNSIDAEGCTYFSMANWNNLTQLNLNGNSIKNEGCKYLSSAKWDNLTQLDINGNSIGNEGCKNLSSAKWEKLIHLNLRKNSIGDEGCKYLSSAVWDNLTQLDLNGNGIGDEGCKHLSSAKWEKLIHLNLRNNSIDAEGCKYFSMANWNNLTQLDLYENDIDQNQIKQLRTSITQKFPKLPKKWNIY